MSEPSDECCGVCGKPLLVSIFAGTQWESMAEMPLTGQVRCYECEMKELTRKVAEELMRDGDEPIYGPPGSD